MTTKTLFTALALAALVATPALAAKKPAHHSTASGPYASEAASQANPTVGTDPDPRIRFELLRDSDTSEGLN